MGWSKVHFGSDGVGGWVAQRRESQEQAEARWKSYPYAYTGKKDGNGSIRQLVINSDDESTDRIADNMIIMNYEQAEAVRKEIKDGKRGIDAVMRHVDLNQVRPALIKALGGDVTKQAEAVADVATETRKVEPADLLTLELPSEKPAHVE